MKITKMTALLASVLLCLTSVTAFAEDKMSAAEQEKACQEILVMRDATLKRLYKIKPATKAEIAKAEGYAVFDSNQQNIVLLVAGSGHGVLVDNATGQNTFMKMKRLGTGPGLGFKKYKQVLVFKSRKLLDQFKSVGADVTASGDATLKMSEGKNSAVLDGAVSFNPMISVYQMTDRGALLQANWGGMAYTPDDALNPPKPAAPAATEK